MTGAVLTVALSFALPTVEARLALYGLCLSPLLLGAWCVNRTGLWIGLDGVVVRGFVRTRRVPLGKVRAFVPGACGWWGNGYPAPVLERTGAGRIPIFTLGREGVAWKFEEYLEQLEPVCDELNALLRVLQFEAGQVPRTSLSLDGSAAEN
jgi:hypothetical protein